jgi:hypothetical protein
MKVLRGNVHRLELKYIPALYSPKIHAALSYYYEHQEELDSDIARRHAEVEKMASESADSPLRRKLLNLKKT